MFINIIKMFISIFNSSFIVRDDICGFENFGNLFWMIVRNIIIVKRIVIEKLIFLFDFKGKKKINVWRRLIKKIGSIMLYI